MKQGRTALAISLPLLLVPTLWLAQPERGTDLALRSVVGETSDQERSVVVRRLWEGEEPDFWSADISPDGRYMTETDWITGDLAVLDLRSGELQRVTDKGSWSEAVEWAEASVFSPDGSRIAVNWWNQDAEGYEIRTVGLDGLGVRTVLANEGQLAYSMPDAWSRDGQYILARLWNGEGDGQVGLVSVDDGSVRPLVDFENWDEPGLTVLSPDGRFVAFDRPRSRRADDYDIFIASVEGGRVSTLLDGPGDDRVMGWAPDGSGILFHSDRELSEGFWWLPMAGGTPAGDPRLVKSNVWRPEPIGFAADGRYFYGVDTQESQVHTAGIDLGSNRLTTPPAAVESPTATGTRFGEWSPDGRFLAYVSYGNPGARRPSIVVRSTTGDGRQEIPSDGGNIRQIIWLDDGSLVVEGSTLAEDGQPALYRIDLQTGQRETLYRIQDPDQRRGTLSRDGRTLFYQVGAMGATGNTIKARDLATGNEREIARIDGSGKMRPSPDGRFLMVQAWEREAETTRLLVVSVSSGSVRELFEVKAPKGLSAMDWTPDGAAVVFSTWDEAAFQGLWKIDLAGGEPTPIAGPHSPQPSSVRIHPAGNRIAYNSGQPRGEVWVVEGLPGSSPAAER